MNPVIHKIKTIAILFFVISFSATSQDIDSAFLSNNAGNTWNSISQNEIEGSRHILEVSHGQAFVDWTEAWAWIFSCNYLYRLNKSIAAGGGIGLQFDWTGLYPALSANLIFGNKSENFAAGLDLRYMFTDLIEGSNLWVTVGGYYKNFFIKVMPTFLFGYPKEWYFEAGYSFDINW